MKGRHGRHFEIMTSSQKADSVSRMVRHSLILFAFMKRWPQQQEEQEEEQDE